MIDKSWLISALLWGFLIGYCVKGIIVLYLEEKEDVQG